MSITLSEKEKRAIAALIQEQIDEHLSRFPYTRYPVEPLDEWKRMFCDPATVPITALRQALGWHFGAWQRKDMPSAHSRTILAIVKAWPEFVQGASFGAAQSFQFWEKRLHDWQNGFNAAAFLLHLLRPDDFEIADQHRIQAMSELLKAINHQDSEQTFSRSLQDLERYSELFRAIIPKLSYGAKNRLQLDRFLKAYGNRNAYKNVAAGYSTKEPEITNFSWTDAKSRRFDLSKIKLRSNADVLFASLLLSLDKHIIDSNELTIGHIIDLLPPGTAGICNPASFNYAMVALFGSQKGRDYFQFENATLKEAFTEQANQSTRDMRFHTRHSAEKILINPKYKLGN
ncbi:MULTISPECIES: hypothetical protein [unclassified Paenibacillus]|uniref:hypothetical protein n=1 Tax=unclassified Paenibacillus TaxID=185978 RepID=UPI001AE4E727|nr:MULTISPECIES: hypothetical protein [unclassified Paenibacillus]MBP1157676.1 hypothetical protein [Paenibacillus sp. PvP091]MBP1171587.1 hypothetical protein [Paenibacillus sp. PvR098]MBP2437968.1 hypothetical protein [Paenibacillus sp. PvP052]